MSVQTPVSEVRVGDWAYVFPSNMDLVPEVEACGRVVVVTGNVFNLHAVEAGFRQYSLEDPRYRIHIVPGDLNELPAELLRYTSSHSNIEIGRDTMSDEGHPRFYLFNQVNGDRLTLTYVHCESTSLEYVVDPDIPGFNHGPFEDDYDRNRYVLSDDHGHIFPSPGDMTIDRPLSKKESAALRQ